MGLRAGKSLFQDGVKLGRGARVGWAALCTLRAKLVSDPFLSFVPNKRLNQTPQAVLSLCIWRGGP